MTKVYGSTKLKQYYKLYCESLSEVIIKAKSLSYNELIKKPQNEAKTTWNIIKAETGNRGKNVEQINNSIFNPDALNNNFLTITKEISDNIYRSTSNNSNKSSKLIQCLYQTFKYPLPQNKI
jgi:hypothetical protein